MTDLQNIAELASQAPQWRDRDGRTPIPLTDWGKDHWSLLAYVENRTVDHHGRIDWRRLTLSARNWPWLFAARDEGAALGRYTEIFSGDAADKYGLRLMRRPLGTVTPVPETLYGHCEGDALLDLRDAGLITIEMPPADRENDVFLQPSGKPVPDSPSPALVTGFAELTLMPWAKFALTDLGRHYNNTLRAHKATKDATWANFIPPAPPLACSGPGGCTRTVPAADAEESGWQQLNGRWYDPQCAADHADRDDFLNAKGLWSAPTAAPLED